MMHIGSPAAHGFAWFTISLVVSQPATVDGLVDAALQAGATTLEPVAKSLWGYGGVVYAPDGTIWKVATSSKKNTGPATRRVDDVVLLLGASDVGASKRFYVRLAVRADGGSFVDPDHFGWEASAMSRASRGLTQRAPKQFPVAFLLLEQPLGASVAFGRIRAEPGIRQSGSRRNASRYGRSATPKVRAPRPMQSPQPSQSGGRRQPRDLVGVRSSDRCSPGARTRHSTQARRIREESSGRPEWRRWRHRPQARRRQGHRHRICTTAKEAASSSTLPDAGANWAAS